MDTIKYAITSKFTSPESAIDAIAKFANGEGFEEKVVGSLAKYFKTMKFQAQVVGGAQVTYWVGFFVDPNPPPKGIKPRKPDLIRFLNVDSSFGKKGNNLRMIQSAIGVPTLRVAPTPPPLVTSTLDFARLAVAAQPKVVLTSQLSGCTFAIGIADDKYVMSHCQAESGARGIDLARAIHGRAQKFQGTITRSTFLIHPGDTIDARSGFGYGDPSSDYHKASVLGLVVKHTATGGLVSRRTVTYSLCFIVSVTTNTTSIEKVVVITHKDSEWKVEEITD